MAKVNKLLNPPKACECCGNETEICPDGVRRPIDLRPYGENGQWICFGCGMSPKLKPIVDKTFNDILKNNDIIIR